MQRHSRCLFRQTCDVSITNTGANWDSEATQNQVERQMKEFQSMIRQQGNPILAYTLERVKEVLDANFAIARQRLYNMLPPQSTW